MKHWECNSRHLNKSGAFTSTVTDAYKLINNIYKCDDNERKDLILFYIELYCICYFYTKFSPAEIMKTECGVRVIDPAIDTCKEETELDTNDQLYKELKKLSDFLDETSSTELKMFFANIDEIEKTDVYQRIDLNSCSEYMIENELKFIHEELREIQREYDVLIT